MLTGKYEVGRALPKGPRALLFRQILPGLAPLLAELRSVAAARGKTPSQVGALAPRSMWHRGKGIAVASVACV